MILASANSDMENVEIDVELLMYLVEEKPVLWDRSDEHYQSRNLTVSAWREICSRLYVDFDGLRDKEKNEFCKLIIYLCVFAYVI